MVPTPILLSNTNLKSIARANSQLRRACSIVSNSTDDDMSDNGLSAEHKAEKNLSTGKPAPRQQQKRVTWSGLDELDYVPTRTGPRKPIRRSVRKRAAMKKKTVTKS